MPSPKREAAAKILAAIKNVPVGEVNLMEVCGTHTMAIAKSGIKSILPENIKLLSGPGCPVCVTPPEVIDAVLELSMRPDVIIATYGDMVRVPGSVPGDSLQRRRALGAKIEVVYSPVDAVELAKNTPDKEIVFLGVGFETTAPGTAAAVLTAKEAGVRNFSVWSMLKTCEPAIRALTELEGFNVQGFICPGHVGTIIGVSGFDYMPRDLHIPGVISGFEAEDILLTIYMLLKQLESGNFKVENEYKRAVNENGNPLAQKMVEKCFEPRSDIWRGLGRIEASGLGFKEELSEFDAEKKFSVKISSEPKKTACRCGEVITGRISPQQCPMFGRACTPEDPVGPCMVSSEGACAAAYKYQMV